MEFKELPPLGEQLDGGLLAGLTTNKDGVHCAVVLLPGKGYDLDWSDAKAWATAQGGELPSRTVAALLFANVNDHLRPDWHWTSDELESLEPSFAWYFDFAAGGQIVIRMNFVGMAVAVRLVPLES